MQPLVGPTRDEQDPLRRTLGPDAPDERGAVPAWHDHVHDQQVERAIALFDQSPGLHPIAGQHHAESLGSQRPGNHGAQNGLIVYNQH